MEPLDRMNLHIVQEKGCKPRFIWDAASKRFKCIITDRFGDMVDEAKGTTKDLALAAAIEECWGGDIEVTPGQPPAPLLDDKGNVETPNQRKNRLRREKRKADKKAKATEVAKPATAIENLDKIDKVIEEGEEKLTPAQKGAKTRAENKAKAADATTD